MTSERSQYERHIGIRRGRPDAPFCPSRQRMPAEKLDLQRLFLRRGHANEWLVVQDKTHCRLLAENAQTT